MLTVAVMVLTNELRSRMSDSASFAGVVGDAAVRIHQAMVHYNPESCWYGDKPQHASNSDQDSKFHPFLKEAESHKQGRGVVK